MKIDKIDKNMAVKDAEKGLLWHNAESLTIEGKGWQDTEDFFDRLPLKAKGVVRDPVWSLSKSSAGISVHFTSNTPSLAVRWDSCGAMDHMAATGVSGVDLYVRHEGKWQWLATGRPLKESNESQLFQDIPAAEREYMLNMPLYRPVRNVKIGVPEGFELKASAPRQGKPVVFYGTSITQGGCASRPGMCYSAIIGRKLDMPVINLGFSGNGIMEPEVMDLLCELDPSVYVLDNLPNMQKDRIELVEEQAIRKLRAARPDTPIVLIDNIFYSNAFLLSARMERYQTSNAAQYAIYEKLVAEGMKGLYYIKDNGLIGADNEGTVDGTHLTDLGYMRFAEAVSGIIANAIAGK